MFSSLFISVLVNTAFVSILFENIFNSQIILYLSFVFNDVKTGSDKKKIQSQITFLVIDDGFLKYFFSSIRFCHDIFDRDYKATIGVDFEVEKFSILAAPYTLQV